MSMNRGLPMLLALLILAGYPPTPAVAADEVADRFACQDCHVKRLREFKRKEMATLIPYDPKPTTESGKQDDASTPAMCFSCHDGFVMDSRALWKEGHLGHPIGVYPPEGMTISMVDGEPEFPMNDDGKMYCGTCHWAHSGEGEAADAPSFMRVSSKDGQLCQACHQDKRSIAGSPHESGSSRRSGARDFEPKGVCLRCHTPHQAKGPMLWAREPGAGNTPVNTLCRSCHKDDPQPAEHPAQVAVWSQAIRGVLRSDATAEMPVFDEQARQSGVGAIGCPTCHDAHRYSAGGDNSEGGLFLRQQSTAGFLCADCHAQPSIYRYQFFHTKRARRGKL